MACGSPLRESGARVQATSDLSTASHTEESILGSRRHEQEPSHEPLAPERTEASAKPVASVSSLIADSARPQRAENFTPF